MPNTHYKFDPESLQYDQIKTTRKMKIFRIVTQIIAAFVIAVILFIVFSYFFESPKQKNLNRDNAELAEQYKVLQERYEQTEKVLQDVQKRDDNIYKAIFETNPVHNVTLNYTDPYKQFDGVDNAELVEETTLRLEKVGKQLHLQTRKYQELIEIIKSKQKILQSIPSIQPLPNKDLQFSVYGFGKRIDPVYKTPAFHNGIDFAAPRGTQVFATADGYISKVDDNARGYGKIIKINHGNGYESMYAHLNEILVATGQKIKKGAVIGLVGSTGKAFVPHLHYEVIYNGKQVNPIYFFFEELSPEKYDKILTFASRGGLSLD